MELNKEIGKMIRQLRQKQQLTQQELAFRSNTAVTYLSGIENGRHHLSLQKFIDIMTALNISPTLVLEKLIMGS